MLGIHNVFSSLPLNAPIRHKPRQNPSSFEIRSRSTTASIQKAALPKVSCEMLLLSAVGGRVGVQQADNSDLLHLNLLRVVQFDLDVLEYESPHVVAETVCVEMSL